MQIQPNTSYQLTPLTTSDGLKLAEQSQKPPADLNVAGVQSTGSAVSAGGLGAAGPSLSNAGLSVGSATVSFSEDSSVGLAAKG